MIMNYMIFLTLFFPAESIESTAYSNDLILGTWTDCNHELLIQCFKKNDRYFGKIIWVENIKHKGMPLDENEKFWINYQVMKDFEFVNGRWINGRIIDIKNNKSYEAFITVINPNAINVTGFIWLPIFSNSSKFYRV